MHPILFRIPGVDLPVNSYGFMIMLGFLLATYLGVRRARALGLDTDIVLDIGIIGMIFGIVGAKVNYVLQYPSTSSSDYQVFDLSDGTLSWIGALVGGGIPYFFWWMRARAEEKVELWSWRNGILLVLTLAFALFGARALGVYLERDKYDFGFFRSWQSGFVLYGGLVAGILAGVGYTLMRRQPLLKIADLLAGPMMIGIAFGRIGCFLNGCCFGVPASGFPGVRFPETSPLWQEYDKLHGGGTHPLLHPAQLYETAAGVAFFFLLAAYDRKWKKNEGETIMLAGLLYPAWRFVIEFFRSDDRPAWFGKLTYSQSLSLLIFAACAAGWWILRNRKAPLTGTPGDKLAAAEKPAA